MDRISRALLGSVAIVALALLGCTHHSQVRYLEPLGPVKAATAPVTPGEARPTAFVAPVTVVGAEGARGEVMGAALRAAFAEAARETGVFGRVVAAGAAPAGAVEVALTVEDALAERWFYALFWGHQVERYRVELTGRLTVDGRILAELSEAVERSGLRSGHVFLEVFPITANLMDPERVRRLAMGDVMGAFARALVDARPTLAGVAPAPAQAEGGPAVKGSAAMWPADAPPMPTLHTLDVGLGVVLRGQNEPLLVVRDDDLRQSRAGPVIDVEYGIRPGVFLGSAGAARWIPEVRLGVALWQTETTLERCVDGACEVVAEDRGGNRGADTRVFLRQNFDLIDYWGFFFEGGLGLRLDQDTTDVSLSEGIRTVSIRSLDEGMRAALVSSFGGGIELGSNHSPVQVMARCRVNWAGGGEDGEDGIELAGVVRFNL